MEFFVTNFEKFMLVFSRILGLVLVAPFYGSDNINVTAKLGLTFFITAILFPVVYTFIPAIPANLMEYGMIAIMEGLIGTAIGFCLSIYFSVFQLAGQYFTVQMGFGASEVFDPLSEISLPLMGQYLYLVAILVFLSLQGPLLIIKEIYHSFELVSVNLFLKYSVVESKFGMISIFADMLLIALRLSLPIVGTLLLVTVATGLLAKAAPQMNLLMIGFPISITVSFLILIFVLPGIIEFTENFVDEMFKNIWFLMMELRK